MVVEATRGVEMRARKRKRDRDAQVGVAFPALPFDVAVSLVEKHLPDPADLAVLRLVEQGIRVRGGRVRAEDRGFGENEAVSRGYLSTLMCLRRRGKLTERERLLCAAAAEAGISRR